MMSAELPATGSPSHDERGRDDHGDSESVAEYSDHAAATTGGSTPERAEAARRVMLAVRETRAVNGLRYAVAVVLLVATVFVSGGLYLETHRDQKDDFKNQFAGYALRIVGNADLQLERKLAALDAMATPYTSQALSSADGGGFPNVTLPHAEIRGANARILADTLFCQYLVLVTDETRAGWEAYAAENEKSMDEEYYREVDQRARQDSRFNLTSPTTQPVVRLDGYRPKIYDLSTVRPDGSGPYMVYWQSSPVMPTKFLLNFDMLSHPNIRNVLLKMMETEQAALDTASNLLLKVDGEKAISANEIFDFFVANGQFRHQIKEYEGSPITNIAYPVFDSFGEDRKLAGAITTALFWREHFVNVLPDNAEAVIAVIQNTCNQTFSFRVDGQSVIYLGPIDAHDPKYDYLAVRQAVASGLKSGASPRNRAYTTVDLDDSMCRYTLTLYPSQELEDAFVNNRPIIYTVIVASIFAFTSLVFVMYDLLVARRQRIVMTKALQSGAIINSLFPENVQARLFAETDDNKTPTKLQSTEDIDENHKTNDAIADLFPCCTVLFADIAGFTGWSSDRSPKDVFELLETLFGVFDAIALNHKVFKVETIGDCYLAVTGLPEPQVDHAIIMCRFANEMVLKMSQVRNDLVGRLGPETAELQLRVGLHSGPVTAGVLRGQKSRFQLFGDTVNTASRMESTSDKGQIQISQTTADELMDRRKGHWLVARNDKVFAKGKGEMQTYWLRVNSTKSSVSSGFTAESPVNESSGHGKNFAL